MMNHRLVISVGVLGILSVLGLGCGSTTDQGGANVVGQKRTDLVNEANTALTLTDAKTGSYSSIGEGARIPVGFPEDVPAYPGAKTLSVSLAGDRKSATLRQTTSEGMEKVVAALEETIKAQGYTVTKTTLSGTTKIVILEKGKVKITISVGNYGSGAGTTIIITREEG